MQLDDIMQLGKQTAQKSKHPFRHGAVFISALPYAVTGYNEGNLHAEIAALRKVPTRWREGGVMYSFRVTRSGRRFASAKPCPNCLKLMRKWGVKRVYFTTAERSLAWMQVSP